VIYVILGPMSCIHSQPQENSVLGLADTVNFHINMLVCPRLLRLLLLYIGMCALYMSCVKRT
jgi:hypothetical protein